jgi:hypothetical protein
MVVSYSVVTLVFITFDRSDHRRSFILICECSASTVWCRQSWNESLAGLVVSFAQHKCSRRSEGNLFEFSWFEDSELSSDSWRNRWPTRTCCKKLSLHLPK